MTSKISWFGAGLFLLAATAVQAHHSRAMFDQTKQVELEGTVRLFSWNNPHCYIQLIVKNAQGKDEEWSVEMGAPLHLQEGGWGKYTLKPGDKIKVVISPLRNGRRGGEFESGTRIDGKPLGIAS